MSKSSSRSDPAEFQFELDIGEDVLPPTPAEPQDMEPGTEEDCVILKRKAKKTSSGKASGDVVVGERGALWKAVGLNRQEPSEVEVRARQAEPGHELDKADFKPRKLDGKLAVEAPDPGRVDATSHAVDPVRERPVLEGLGRSADFKNRMSGTGDGGMLWAVASMRGRLGLAHLQRNKAALAVVITVTILALALRMLLHGPEDEPARQAVAKPQQAEVTAVVEPIAGTHPHEGGSTLLIRSQRGESEAQRDLRARDTLEKFFMAKDPSAMGSFIRDPERVQPLIEDYYSRHPFAMTGVSEIVRFQEIMINLKIFLIADIVLEGKGANTVVLQDAGDGFVVDWETYVCYNPMDWDDFYRKRPGPAMSLRVLATLDHNPGFAFPGEAEWVCVRMIARDSDEELYGYVRTGSQTALRVQEMLEDEWEFPCILQLQFPEDGKGGDRQVHIKGLVMENWIKVE